MGKVEELIAIELQVGVGASAVTRMVNLQRGSTLVDLTNVISNLKKRKQITWVRQGLKVEEHTVLLSGDSIIAVLAKVEGPFEGFDEPDQKTEPQAEPPIAIAPLAPPPQEKKKIAEAPVEDLLTNAPPEKVEEASPFDFLNTEPKEPLISFGRFSIGDDGEASKEVKVVKEATEKDKLLGDQDENNAELKKEDTFPKFAGFS